ncbi:L-threonine O-3-phosphate decarboxylase [Pseudomonas duriflava]|uniref:threonine-phosphate decarboxylase n=1 Tax=Pseudomonas duriflava TaxID=459528 RepID=A0A562QAL8_9PSED|nr:threonine-phosphate decarboxylase CobD [Pseudomonas duriflava]TWI53754.1 L-threonine O-3-phosphate decarboxylase [Pseudomonas duriflava]
MLEHGGRLRKAAQQYGIPLEQWLDLSTGLAPTPWPIPEIPLSAWARLPEDEDGLEAAAREYYGALSLLPVAGSQAAIQALPALRLPGRVGLLTPCYAEHEQAWRRQGHQVVPLRDDEVDVALDSLDALVLVNPNNPTGRLLTPETLMAWQARLAERGGWLVVDEAFMDLTPAYSLSAYAHRPGLIVLRSFGKFFGLAGIRLGFVLAPDALLARLQKLLGPWAVSGPARAVARMILLDQSGHAWQREQLEQGSQRLSALLQRYGVIPTSGCGLFCWWLDEGAEALHKHLAQRAILTRLFPALSGLRFGLPSAEADWARLEQALHGYKDRS